MVTESPIKINEKIVTIKQILFNGDKYIRLEDLQQAGAYVDYDLIAKMPVLYISR